MIYEDAYNKFYNFVMRNLNAKGNSYKNFYRIDGGKYLCNNCPKRAKRQKEPFYIYMAPGEMIALKCFMIGCGFYRPITHQDFIAFGFDDNEAIYKLMDDSNQNTTKSFGNIKKLITIEDMTLSKEQLDYFQKRTNISLNSDKINFYRIIPNIREVMNDNIELDDPGMQSVINMKIKSNKNAMTFATFDMQTFSYRSIKGDQKLIFNINSTSHNGYTLVRGKAFKTLVITEGIFDLINIYTKYAIMDDTFYVATMGFDSMFNIIKYWCKQYIEIDRLIIFADSDITLPNGNRMYNEQAYHDIIKHLENLFPDIFRRITIVYNRKTKDFGDMSKTISPIIVDIKGGIE